MTEQDWPGRLPNLVLAGVTKAGTTSLFAYLAQHPDVFTPTLKETNYFSPLVHDRPLAALGTYAGYYRDARDERWRLDASPFYFVGADRVAAALARTLESPRVLISLRDPVARLWSSYTYKKSKGYVDRSTVFGDWFDRCRAQFDAGTDVLRDHVDTLTLRTGCYADFLPAWFKRYDADLRVLFAEDLAATPGHVLRDLFGWLSIEDVSERLDYGRRNATRQPRSVRLRRIGYRLNGALKPMLSGRPRLEKALQDGYERVNTANGTETFDDADRRRVREFYAPSIGELSVLLRERGYAGLPAWVDAVDASS